LAATKNNERRDTVMFALLPVDVGMSRVGSSSAPPFGDEPRQDHCGHGEHE
jgi:hypothetical protein